MGRAMGCERTLEAEFRPSYDHRWVYPARPLRIPTSRLGLVASGAWPVGLCGIQLISVGDLGGTWFGGHSLWVSLNSVQSWDKANCIPNTPPPPPTTTLTPTVRPQITIEAVKHGFSPLNTPLQTLGARLWPRQPPIDSCCSPRPSPVVGTRQAAGEEFTASMSGWQLGLQMWGSSEPGDSVTPKWPVCFPRRDGDVEGCLGLENLGEPLPTPHSPSALLLGLPGDG